MPLGIRKAPFSPWRRSACTARLALTEVDMKTALLAAAISGTTAAQAAGGGDNTGLAFFAEAAIFARS